MRAQCSASTRRCGAPSATSTPAPRRSSSRRRKSIEELEFNAICFGLETIMHAAKAMKIVLEDMRAGTFALRDQGMGFEEFKTLVHYDRWDRIDNLYGRPENLQPTIAASRSS